MERKSKFLVTVGWGQGTSPRPGWEVLTESSCQVCFPGRTFLTGGKRKTCAWTFSVSSVGLLGTTIKFPLYNDLSSLFSDVLDDGLGSVSWLLGRPGPECPHTGTSVGLRAHCCSGPPTPPTCPSGLGESVRSVSCSFTRS